MIHARIQLSTKRAEIVPPSDLSEAGFAQLQQLRNEREDAYNAALNAEILAQSALVSVDAGTPVVRVEVRFPDESDAQWEKTGDALEVDFSVDPPTIVPLSPYSEVAP